MKLKAVVLVSGGLDSTTTLAIAQQQDFDIYGLTFHYGQRHDVEISAARRVAEAFQLTSHIVVDIDLRRMGGSALTDDIDVPKNNSADEIGSEIPVTYVPARNTIFLSFALAWAEVLQCNDIFIGVNALDYSGYPDCRPEYIAAFQEMANRATKRTVEGQPVTIHTPLIHWSKSKIIQRGLEYGVDYGMTTSCYDPSATGLACGHCDACLLRIKGFAENGMTDPAQYVN